MDNEIKKIRHDTGLPAKIFARLIGSNECSMYNFESGRSRPRYPKIMKRARALVRLFDYLKNNPDYIVDYLENQDSKLDD